MFEQALEKQLMITMSARELRDMATSEFSDKLIKATMLESESIYSS